MFGDACFVVRRFGSRMRSTVVLPDVPVVVRCACALEYVILLKLVGRGCVPGLKVLWKSPVRFLDECHLAFCFAFDSPLNRLATQMGCAELDWERLEGSLCVLQERWGCVRERKGVGLLGCMLVLSRRLPCCVLTCHVSSRAGSRHDMSCQVRLRHPMSCHLTSWKLMSSNVLS